MNLKIKYVIFIGLIHIVLGYLVYHQFKDQKIIFLVSELFILISIGLAINIYKSFIKPLDFIASGTDAIKDKDFNVKFLKTGTTEMDKLIEVYNEMIDNIRNERIQIKEQDFFLQKLIKASPVGILILDYDHKLTELNPRAMEIFNLPENVINKKLPEIASPFIHELDAMQIGESKMIQLDKIGKFKVQVSDFIHRGFHRKFIFVQELTKEILAAEKQAYGKIIRMMAHEVNNSIGAINSILHSLSEFYTVENIEDQREINESLKIAMDRNDNLNKFMQNFANVVRLPNPVLKQMDVNQVLQHVSQLLRLKLKSKKISLELQLSERPILIQGDQSQLEQVFLNIIKNAMESIEQDGQILISSSYFDKSVYIKDNGKGIPKEVAGQIFTPFFSTKVTGQGVGLTLVKEILLNHKVDFSLKTKEDGWTYFTANFPT